MLMNGSDDRLLHAVIQASMHNYIEIHLLSVHAILLGKQESNTDVT